MSEDLAAVPLDGLHRELGAKMVPFAGFAMPVQYPAGIIKEHQHTRQQASLFDASHMGQVRLHASDPQQALQALEKLTPGALTELAPHSMRYTVFTNDRGGIIDDFMACHCGHHVGAVFNAARRSVDWQTLTAGLPSGVQAEFLDGWGLLALQGPAAGAVMARLCPALAELRFMQQGTGTLAGVDVLATRSGYTGEDGFEITVPPGGIEAVARHLLAAPEVEPAGLGARDTLRLEAGLCLYGQDLDEETTPVEAGIRFVIGKRRRQEGGFPGDDVILAQLRDGPPRKRVGLLIEGRAPARHGATVLDGPDGEAIGTISSGGHSPTLGQPIAMAYVPPAYAGKGTRLAVQVRKQALPAEVAAQPFVAHRYAL